MATGCGLGYLPKAPGTFGSLWGPVLFYFAREQSAMWWNVMAVVVFFFSVLFAQGAEQYWQKKDDQRIVIDEVCGMWVTYCFVAFNSHNLILGFLFFRFFDVLKLFPARLAQDKIKGGLGVVADDVVAGLQAGSLLWLINDVVDLFFTVKA